MPTNFVIDRIIGRSEWADRIRKRILQIANYRYSVLITGPTGTGKELVARAIHIHSPRSPHPFIPVNCATISGSLFTSQLFGHVKGAFTGAVHSSLGCFRAAENGTIFLDEIGDLDPDCQAKLLRVLQDREVVPVGAHQGVAVDVRVIAATNKDLQKEVEAGRFRLDLFYRLNILSVQTESLKNRVDDIELLTRHFLAKTAVENGLPLKKMSPDALALLKSYDWPGNVRELQNVIERAAVFSEEETICSDVLSQMQCFGPLGEALAARERERRSGESARTANVEPPAIPGTVTADDIPHEIPDDDWLTLAELERKHLVATLQRTKFNQSAAARLLGVDRKLLARKMKKHDIRVEQFSEVG